MGGGVDTFKQITMRYSTTLLEQIEAFQIEKGFPTRAQTVTYLLIMALDAQKKNNILSAVSNGNDTKCFSQAEKHTV